MDTAKVSFFVVIVTTLTMFIWGISQIVYEFTGTTVIKASLDGYSVQRYIAYNSIERPKQMKQVIYNNQSIVYVCGEQGVYALIDTDMDHQNDVVLQILPSITSRSCTSVTVDYQNEYLYITEWEKTYRCFTNTTISNGLYENIHEQVLVSNSIASSCHLWFEQEYYAYHGWHFTDLSPSGQLCIAGGVPCNICSYSSTTYPQGTIICLNDMENPSLDDSTVYADGVRDSVGFAWDSDGTMWFTDHNVDNIGEEKPDCELNKLSFIGENFGFPYCHSLGEGENALRDAAKTQLIVDELYGADINNNCSTSKYTPAIQPLGAHVAPDGVMVWNAQSSSTQKVLLIAEHGSWNTEKDYVGYRVAMVVLDASNDQVLQHKVFVDGWVLQSKQLWSGRPVQLLELDDGSVLISDDAANTIYRAYYDANGGQQGVEEKCIGGHWLKLGNHATSYERQG